MKARSTSWQLIQYITKDYFIKLSVPLYIIQMIQVNISRKKQTNIKCWKNSHFHKIFSFTIDPAYGWSRSYGTQKFCEIIVGFRTFTSTTPSHHIVYSLTYFFSSVVIFLLAMPFVGHFFISHKFRGEGRLSVILRRFVSCMAFLILILLRRLSCLLLFNIFQQCTMHGILLFAKIAQ